MPVICIRISMFTIKVFLGSDDGGKRELLIDLAEVPPGRVVELKGLGFLTPDLKYGLFFVEMSGAVLESNDLAVDMAEEILRKS